MNNIQSHLDSLNNDIKLMMKLLDDNNISYKHDIGYPIDDLEIISDAISNLKLENSRIEVLEDNISDLERDLERKDDEISDLECEIEELKDKIDDLQNQLDNN